MADTTPGYLSNAALAEAVQEQTDTVKTFKDEQVGVFTTSALTAQVSDASGSPMVVPSWAAVKKATSDAAAAAAAAPPPTFGTIAAGLAATVAPQVFAYDDGSGTVRNVQNDGSGNWHYTGAVSYTQASVQAVATTALAKADGAPSKNLADINAADVVMGGYPSATDGTVQTNASFNATGFIPVTASTTYMVSSRAYVAYYNTNKAFVAGQNASATQSTVLTPANAAYMRLGVKANSAAWTRLQVELGSTATAWAPFASGVLAQRLLPASVTEAIIATGSVTPSRTTFLVEGKNLFNKAVATVGFEGADGTVSTATGFYVSPIIPVTAGATYYGAGATHGMRFTSYYNALGQQVTGGLTAEGSSFTVPSGVSGVRVSVYAADIDSFQLELGAAATAFETYRRKLSGTGAPIYADPVPKGITTDKIADQAITPDQTNFLYRSKNLFNKDSVTLGTFMGSAGTPTANANYNLSDYIPVVGGATYYGASATNGTRFLTYFNAAKAVIGGSNSEVTSFTAPAAAAFVRVTVYAGNTMASYQLELGSAATAYVQYGYTIRGADGAPVRTSSDNAIVSKWTNKAWAALGDSITAQAMWEPAVVTSLGLLFTNCGVSGSTVAGPASSTTAMSSDTRVATVPATSDLVTFLGGTNDWAQSVAMGTADATDPTVFQGALNVLITKLVNKLPAGRIVLMTTTYGEMLDFATRGWANKYTNNQGLTTRDYAAAIRAAGLRWGLPVIDLSAMIGWNTLNIATYLTNDGNYLHPNTVGGARVASIVIGGLRALEPTA